MKAKALKFLFIACTVVVMAGCKLIVAVQEGGSVQSGSGGNDCAGNSLCEIEITDTTFSDTFTAVPATGFVFSRWEEGDGFLCGNTTNATCTVNNTVVAGNATANAVIATDRAFYIRPIFELTGGYLGVTSGSYDGSPLISGWTAACKAEYGATAVVCTPEQFLGSSNIENVVITENTWIRNNNWGVMSNLYCGGNFGGGSIITAQLTISAQSCTVSTPNPIACCR